MDVFYAEMDATRPDRFRKTVIGIIFVVGKIFFPAFNQTGRNRLSADVHQPPLLQFVILQFYIAAFDGIQNVLCPRNQQPDNCYLFFGYHFEYPFRFDATQQNRFAAGEKTAEPVHFRSGMIERWYTKKIVFARLLVVSHFHFARYH